MQKIEIGNWLAEDILSKQAIKELKDNYRSNGLVIIHSPLKFVGKIMESYLNEAYNIRVEDLLIYRPAEGEYRAEEIELILNGVGRLPLEHSLVIITQGEMINKKLYDKLLKTLEEPGNNVTIALIAESISDIPTTILGRANLTIKITEVNELVLASLKPEELKLLKAIRYDVELYNSIVDNEVETEVDRFINLIYSYQESEVKKVVDNYEEIAEALKLKSKDLSFKWEFLWREMLHQALLKGDNYEALKIGYHSFNRGRAFNSNFSLLLVNFLLKKF